MFKTLTSAMFAAAVIAGGASMSAPIPANAQGMELQIGPNGVTPRMRDDDSDRDYDRRHHDRDMGRHRCDPEDAEDAARDYGFRHPHVVQVTPRSVTVEGMTRDGPDRMRFRNVPGCPAYR